MGIIKLGGKPTVPVEAAPKAKKEKEEESSAGKYELPEGPQKPITDLSAAAILIYGENKIGKTSLAACFDDPIFIMFEPGGKGLEITRVQCETWKDFTGWVTSIIKSDRFKTVVIDPIALCYRACVEQICKDEAVDDPMEVGWGRGWKKVEDEFCKQIRRISSTERGVVFLGHIESVEFERRTGGVYHRLSPRMMKQARTFITGWVDIIAFYGYYGDDRYLTIEGSDELDAGTRLKLNFKTTSGERVHSIPMFDPENPTFSEEDAYRNLVAAFRNEQEERGVPESVAALTDTKPPRKEKRR